MAQYAPPHSTTARALPTYVAYGTDNRKWEFDNTSTLSSLRQFTSIQFNIKQFALTYTREQRRPITIIDDKDWNEAFTWTTNANRDKLQIFVNDEVSRQFPLCQFTTNDLCGAFTQAFRNPSSEKSISHLETIFTEHEISGNKWMQSHDIKDTVKAQMLDFMTEATFNIIFQSFDQFKKNDNRDIVSKSANQMARILYEYPLKQLLTALRKDRIDGQRIIGILDDIKYIRTHTGWGDKQIHEIKSALLRNWTFTKKEFIDHMNSVLYDRSQPTSLSNMIIDKMKHVLVELDVEQIHYDIRNNRNIQYFSDIVIQMVNDIIRQYPKQDGIDCDLIHTIYETVALCFIARDNNSLNWNSVFNLSDCTYEHIAYIVDKFVFQTIDISNALNEHRSKIIECIKTNQINGKQLHDRTISRDKFASICCDHCQCEQLRRPLLRLYAAIQSFEISSCLECSVSHSYRIVRKIRQRLKWGLPVQIVCINKIPSKWNQECKVELIKHFVTEELKTDRFALKYRDEDENELDIDDDNDLIEAFQCAQSKKFSVMDICNTIKQWVYNDKYNHNLSKLEQLLSQHKLYGEAFVASTVSWRNIIASKMTVSDVRNRCPSQFLVETALMDHRFKNVVAIAKIYHEYVQQKGYDKLSLMEVLKDLQKNVNGSWLGTLADNLFETFKWSDDQKTIFKQLVLQLMEDIRNKVTHTIDIVLNETEEWIKTAPATVKFKSIKQMAQVLHYYPLKQLITQMQEDEIDGTEIISILHDNKYIQSHTGWASDEVEQIKLILLRYWTFSKDEFMDNLEYSLYLNESLSTVIIGRIRNIMLDFDVELLHFKMKNNKDIEEFSDAVISMVNDIVEEHHEEHKATLNDIVEE
eukprot:302268_1